MKTESGHKNPDPNYRLHKIVDTTIMKNIIYILFLLFFSCCFPKSKKNVSEQSVLFKTNTDIEKIILHHVTLVGIYTAMDIPCEDFEEAFSDIMRKDTITNRNEIDLLRTYMNNLNPISNPLSIDTRARLYFISPIDTVTYCIDSGIIYSNGNYYEISDALFDYIEKFEYNTCK